ncbi:MAG TPA: family 43 glycosylhydrolase, partial [Ignavibacteriaceae bacterium]|nr:family 43 glycosylhydrolase [Ignavibacteriaceae bacterium]
MKTAYRIFDYIKDSKSSYLEKRVLEFWNNGIRKVHKWLYCNIPLFHYSGIMFLIIIFLFIPANLSAQKSKDITKSIANVWVPDLGNGKYRNPIIYADYSDPDVIRVGNDFYLVSSSFDQIPGLPILHSKDLVNWTIIGHALLRQPPYNVYSKAQHGNGVWAPSIRYHKGEFYIYYPDVDYGIYMVKTKNPAGPWSIPVLVQAGKGLEDPCPLW